MFDEIRNVIAKFTSNVNPSAAYKKSRRGPAKEAKRQEDVKVFVTESMVRERMKLPARMFDGKSFMYVDDMKINSQDKDRGRSDKLDPQDYFNADAGDTIVFTHLGGNKWEYETYEGTKADKRLAQQDGRASQSATHAEAGKATSKPVTRNITKSRKQAKDEAKSVNKRARADKKLTRTEKAVAAATRKKDEMSLASAPKALKSFIQRYADMCIDNHEEDPKFRNLNIVGSTYAKDHGLDADARVLLTSRQSSRFRRERKAQFPTYTLKEIIALLNEAVYE